MYKLLLFLLIGLLVPSLGIFQRNQFLRENFSLYPSNVQAAPEKKLVRDGMECKKLTCGYDGVKWGTDLSKDKGFVVVPNKTPFQLASAVTYESPSHTNVILEGRNIIRAEKVTFVCLKGKLSALSIIVKSGKTDEVPQSFFFIANAAKELYGEPTSGSIHNFK